MKIKLMVITLLSALCLFIYVQTDSADQDPFLITDYSRLHPVKVERVIQGREEAQLVELVRDARDQGKTISIAGQRHSQGGHTYYKDGIVVDMTHYNRILEVDPVNRKIRVQAGATWEDVQNAVNPPGLAVRTMQSQNLFTIGGSVSINAHGRDIRNGSLIASVESFRLLTADGNIREVSRTVNADLFPLALGGYGLFGIILDVTLTLTDDVVYRMTTEDLQVENYTKYFLQQVKSNPDIELHIARISVSPDKPLTDMYAINYTRDASIPLSEHNTLKTKEKWVVPTKALFQLNRSFDWGKEVLWNLQKEYFHNQKNALISRNNAMRSESQFMEYSGAGANDFLQEYFIPVGEFAGFVEDLRNVLTEEELNLLNITVRYVNEDEEAVMSYAREDMFALVCLFHAPLSSDAQFQTKAGIRRIIDQVIKHRGTYYLPYAGYPTVKQFQTVYPNYRHFFVQKENYDPGRLFTNQFYEQYNKGESTHS
ncbi:FAD-binding protein [Paenibacillus swuensis]|uniref:FAD-binding protein n=1 Tax=Paenibacillus swuensis TaxID=1178515 RepID=A0A172TM94_9BACL|nr:FAD-binding oxidoreductase [Paenibacillus swuensis]ANE48034.1 FAD-binding protein [Paenibacillus swuensis]